MYAHARGPVMESEQSRYRCHVCGWLLDEAPWGECGTHASWDVCSCCGCEFGLDDYIDTAMVEYRDQWLMGGAVWFAPRFKPVGWNLAAQLALIPPAPPGVHRS